MIIKSCTRKKVGAIGQLVEYIHKQDQHQASENAPLLSPEFTYTANMPRTTAKGITKAFKENASYRRKRKREVILYHDILSFSAKDSAVIKNNPDYVWDMVREYVSVRCPHSVVAAKLHSDTNCYHVHILISGNHKESQKTARLSKAEMRTVKEHMRAYMVEKYPALKHSYTIERYQSVQQKQKDKEKVPRLTKTEQTYTKTKNTKWHHHFDVVEQHAFEAFGKDRLKACFEALSQGKFSVYHREKYIQGIKYEGQKYRLSTLRKRSARFKERYDHRMRQLEFRRREWDSKQGKATGKLFHELELTMSIFGR